MSTVSLQAVSSQEWRVEIWRKAIHGSGIFFLPVLYWNREIFSLLLLVFLAFYFFVEWSLKKNRSIPFLTALTQNSKRYSEKSRISRGALFLGLSSLVLPYVFGIEAAAVGLAQIYIADIASSFVGMKWGRKKLPYAPFKSWAGSIAFLLVSFFISLFFVSAPKALLLAAVGTLMESLPVPEGDNILVPLGVSSTAFFIL